MQGRPNARSLDKYAHSVFYGISNALFYYVLYCARTSNRSIYTPNAINEKRLKMGSCQNIKNPR